MNDEALPLPPELELVVQARDKDLGGLVVGRVLPSPRRRHVGPFVFFDHMGPATIAPGRGMDVRPHPHIGLATMTYLFEGAIVHRDSLGSHQVIAPGAVNWMTAGRGIVHSERTRPEDRETGFALHGIQVWIALPREFEEGEPDFSHYPADAFRTVEFGGARVRVVVGEAFGARSPVRTLSPTFYVDVHLSKGARLELPDYDERAAYVLDGSLEVGGRSIASREMAVFSRAARVVTAMTDSHFLLLGGAPLDGERHIRWNFVSSSSERIEIAERDWKERRFPLVPGDEVDFIPLPD